MRKTVVAIAAAAVMVLVTAGTAWADPAEGCASTCSVGAVGTGGENSDGNASGGRLKGPSTGFPGSTFTNQGHVEIGGHISVTGTSAGMASGAFTPQGAVVGHYTGVSAIFFGMDGPCNGVCTP